MGTRIKVTAPGKTILHGEHAVVYKKAAIAVSLGLKTEVILTLQSDNSLELNLNILNMKLKWTLDAFDEFQGLYKNDLVKPPKETDVENLKNLLPSIANSCDNTSEFQKIALVMFFYLYASISNTYNEGVFPSCAITVESELTLGSGMGSSASYAVCLATALLASVKRVKFPLTNSDLDLISKWAFCAETICHGRPSGIDNSICTYGGALLFENGKISSQLHCMPPIQILLVNSGVPRNTKVLVAAVKEKFNTHLNTISLVMDAIHSISVESWELLNSMAESGDSISQMPHFHELVTMNQHLLNCLGVGHSKLDAICAIASEFKCAAKLTGAGGGGCAFILTNPEQGTQGNGVDTLKKALSNVGFEYWDVLLGGEGVKLCME